MTDSITGEVRLDGPDSHALKFSTEALIRVEDELDISVLALPLLLRRPRLKQIRVLLWAALQDHHEGVSLKAAGDLIAAHGLQEVIAKLGEAMVAAFPKRKDGDSPQA